MKRSVEVPAAGSHKLKVDGREVQLTNLDKLFWKEERITKGDLTAPVAGYVNWLRGDYFARHLLGQSSTSVDIVELNKEREQTGERRR